MKFNSTPSRVLAPVVAVCLGLGSLVLASPTPASGTSASATALFASAKHDAIASRWVHEVASATEGGIRISEVNDIGSTEGRQRISANTGASATLLAFVKSKKLYEEGNAVAVASLFQGTTIDPTLYVNKWLLLTPVDADYASVAESTTLQTDFDSTLGISGAKTLGRVTTIGGVRVRPIKETLPAANGVAAIAVTLYVTTTGKTLPVELRETTTGFSFTAKWSRWGTTVHLVAPLGSVAFPVSTTTTTTTTTTTLPTTTTTTLP
jgi:hypothetical protein